MPDGPDRPFWADEDYVPRKPLKVAGGIQIHSTRGTVARTWWSARFLKVLEELGVGGRLSRGRSYARSGQIVSLDVGPGMATALVQGTRPAPYTVRIGLRTWDKTDWTRAVEALSQDAWYTATLLAGGMPPEIEGLFAGLDLSLFPARTGDGPSARSELSMDCSCPDVTVPCKHVAAVFYLLAERFDADPFELLALRGRDRESLLADLRERRGSGARASGAHRAGSDGSGSGPPGTGPHGSGSHEVGMDDDPAAGDWPALADALADFYVSPSVDPSVPAPPETAPDAVLTQVPEIPIRVRRQRVTDLLRPAYHQLAGED